MKTYAPVQPKVDSAPAFTPVARGRYVAHNQPGPSGACDDCRRKRRQQATGSHVFGNVSVFAPGQIVDNGGAPFPCAAGQEQGSERTVDVQPVVFKSSATDASPTGTSWARRFAESNTIWGKVGVTFNALAKVEVVDATRKTASGATLADFNSIRSAHAGAGIEVFMVDNDMSSRGGGGTISSGSAAAQIVMSDRGTSDTLLAHELGHVLGLGHPPGGSDANTIMTPSGSNNSANPTRNTLGNFNRITWPAAGNAMCIHPDP